MKKPGHSVGVAVLAAALAFAAAGCATTPKPYVPVTLGSLDDPETDGQLEVWISTSQEAAFIGDPIFFTVTIRNTGTRAVWVPRNPDLLMTWIYPNGRRDNMLREFSRDQHYSASEAVLLRAGQQMTKSVAVKTYYFPRTGITEFRAVLHAGRNTNSELSPFWQGELQSNAYGIMVRSAKKNSRASDRVTSAATTAGPAS